MVLTLDQLTILAGLPLVLVFLDAVWLTRLQRDLKSGRRVRLKLRELSLLKKLYGASLVAYLVFVLYSELTTIIPLMTGTESPFLTELQDVVVTLWLGTMGILGFGLLSFLRSPIRKPPLQ